MNNIFGGWAQRTGFSLNSSGRSISPLDDRNIHAAMLDFSVASYVSFPFFCCNIIFINK